MNRDNLAPGINKGVFKYIGVNQQILSIGCGIGLLEAEAKKKGNRVYGVDISQENIKKASKVLDGVFLCDLEKVETLPFSIEMFDIIILGDVIEHLLEPRRMLKMIRPYLKKEGYIIASIPNVANWTVRIPLLFGKFKYGQDGVIVWQHYRFYTCKTASNLIEECGYSVTKIDYTTSIVNVCYDYIKKLLAKKNSQQKGSEKTISQAMRNKKYPSSLLFLKDRIKKGVEWYDYKLTGMFKGLFTFQFIIIARKKEELSKERGNITTTYSIS